MGAWFANWVEAERGRFYLLLPVGMGAAILIYFALPTEPPLWLAFLLPAAIPRRPHRRLALRTSPAHCRHPALGQHRICPRRTAHRLRTPATHHSLRRHRHSGHHHPGRTLAGIPPHYARRPQAWRSTATRPHHPPPLKAGRRHPPGRGRNRANLRHAVRPGPPGLSRRLGFRPAEFFRRPRRHRLRPQPHHHHRTSPAASHGGPVANPADGDRRAHHGDTSHRHRLHRGNPAHRRRTGHPHPGAQ